MDKIVRKTYVIEPKQILGFDENAEKLPIGSRYVLIRTNRGNIAVKNTTEFLNSLKKVLKGAKKVISPEFIIEVKNRLQFDANGKKVPTGAPYIWFEGISSRGLIEKSDLEQFIKDFVEMLK